MHKALHLEGFSFICQRLHQLQTESKSAYKASQSSVDLIVLYKVTSSVKILMSEFFTALQMSKINNNGPKIDSLGTPDDTLHQFENWPLITTV